MNNVKVGDLILYPVSLAYSMWNRYGTTYYIPKKVIRLTKTLITIEGDIKFKRENGIAYAANEWCEIKPYTKAEDQTELHKEMKQKRVLLCAADKKATQLGKTSLEHLFTKKTTNEEIELIIAKLNELQDLIKETK